MKPAFCATSVVCLLLTNNSDLRRIRFIAAIAMTRNSLPDAMGVAKSSVLVSSIRHFFKLLLSESGLARWVGVVF